jgi:hypothetical protein
VRRSSRSYPLAGEVNTIYDASWPRGIERYRVPTLLLLLGMEKNKTNQERRRKYRGSSSFVDMRQPSRAPRQDEQGEETIGSASRGVGPADGTSSQQGISNRPAKDEHAFPESDEPDPQAIPDRVGDEPKQVGGNRGQV